MNARQNFYSSVFEVINSYKKKNQNDTARAGLLSDHMLELGVFSSLLLVASISGSVFSFPQYMTFRSPTRTIPTTVVVEKETAGLFDSDAAEAAVPTIVRLRPEKSTYISVSEPTATFGNSEMLYVSSNPARSVYLQYGVPQREVLKSASLIIPNTGVSDGIVDLYVLSNTVWDPTKASYANEPIGEERFVQSLPISANSIGRLDVTQFVHIGEGATFILRSTSTGVRMGSAANSRTPTALLEIQ